MQKKNNIFYNYVPKSVVKFFDTLKKNQALESIFSLLSIFILFFLTANALNLLPDYLYILKFIIRRLFYVLVVLIVLQVALTSSIVKELQEEMTIFNEGPENKSSFVSLLRKYHFSIFVLIYLSYGLATTYFLNDPIVSYILGLFSSFFLILYLTQFWIYTKAYISRSFNPKNSEYKKGQIRNMGTGSKFLASLTSDNIKKGATVCLECTKAAITMMGGAELAYKLTHGGMNDVSPWRQNILNKTFPEDRTKIWTETKAGAALHNKAMGYPHENIYKFGDRFGGLSGPKKEN